MATKDTPRTAVQDDETRRALEWLFGDDTGLSSRTIAGVMLNLPPAAIHLPSIPYDAGDLGRCQRLLEKLPEWRARLDEVAEAFPQWRPLVEHWRELERLYAEKRPTKTPHPKPRNTGNGWTGRTTGSASSSADEHGRRQQDGVRPTDRRSQENR